MEAAESSDTKELLLSEAIVTPYPSLLKHTGVCVDLKRSGKDEARWEKKHIVKEKKWLLKDGKT